MKFDNLRKAIETKDKIFEGEYERTEADGNITWFYPPQSVLYAKIRHFK